jgi:hypothetical protein
VGDVDDMGDAFDAGDVGVLAIVTDETIWSDRAGMTQAPGFRGNRGVARVGSGHAWTHASEWVFRWRGGPDIQIEQPRFSPF